MLRLQGSLEEARDILSRVHGGAPYDAATMLQLADVEEALGLHDEARRHRTQAAVIGDGGSAYVTTTGATVVKAADAGTSGHPVNYPWMAYLRRTPPILTPPDHLVIVER
jgi:hypothetical protein